MRRFGDRRKPVWLTEISWPASKGKTDSSAPRFVTTERGQASRLKRALSLLVKARKRLKIQRVIWYTWLSREGSRNSFSWSGLRRLRGSELVSARSLAVFRRAAQATRSLSSASTARAVRSQVNGAARARPAARSRSRSAGERTTSHTASDTASGSASRAAPPAVAGSAVTSAAITGVPQAIASSTGRPNPS